ncbi:hypothetical protein V502_03723 [Pseudogymnoascus sp. VKM F-4520 (FW-2644)]|nr:hypothetical protein V502_03723 [Pseudogymnoascus sp. VKM F-4520 (FW-2644)]
MNYSTSNITYSVEIDKVRTMLNVLPDHDASRPDLLDRLSALLGERFAATGSIQDIKAAVSASRKAVAITHGSPIKRASYLNNLSNNLSDLSSVLESLRSGPKETCCQRKRKVPTSPSSDTALPRIDSPGSSIQLQMPMSP